ncbi:DUF1538 domain-containing protein [Nisaea acidiphila]|uniref:DUF1538 domain-containing protein n=1 Tax=Nisaea acidiphila TaxID=1862145 RepID=A0A9J7AN45_9PROT|nr:DUF1538 domain-containing protein [Nisaea acidiphila]UUX48590.1 DUF1538 domain-containing protein [Nisaea acidiphila]
MDWILALWEALLGTVFDVLPIAAILIFFQLVVLRQSIPHLPQVLMGFVYVIIGLALFLVGLEKALFPIGELMAKQLTAPSFIAPGEPADSLGWEDYYWVYLFAAAIGFSTTIAEPSLIAVANKANDLTGGTVSGWGLRVAVAVGVALSIAVGAFRIVTGTPLYLYMIVGYAFVVLQTIYAPRMIIPLAYDSGGVTTSTVTVPLVTALGLGLASTVPGRNPVLDGFGLIALASLFPMLSVMTYAQAGAWFAARRKKREEAARLSDEATPKGGS